MFDFLRQCLLFVLRWFLLGFFWLVLWGGIGAFAMPTHPIYALGLAVASEYLILRGVRAARLVRNPRKCRRRQINPPGLLTAQDYFPPQVNPRRNPVAISRAAESHTLQRLDHEPLSQEIEIDYMNDAGECSLRRVTVRRISGGTPGRPVYFTGHCHLRDSARTFRIDRILTLTVDGTEISNPETWFARLQEEISTPVQRTLAENMGVVAVITTGDSQTDSEAVWDIVILNFYRAGKNFTLTTEAKRRKTATKRAWSGNKTFEVRQIRTISSPDGADRSDKVLPWLGQMLAVPGIG